jgi:glycosyltransferase involved in cell wall biosynthesis
MISRSCKPGAYRLIVGYQDGIAENGRKSIANQFLMNENQNIPLVSVIIPTFNRGRMLKAAIDSVLAQEYQNVELIVVDDGSTDNTTELLNEYGQYLTVISQKNAGVSSARNAGIAAASGRYIAFLDSDDLWLPQKLTHQVQFFNLHPEALICQTEEIWMRDGRRINPKLRHKKLSGMIFEPSLHLCLVSPSAVMIRRSLFDEVGLFDKSLPACEDYDLWLRVSCRYPVYLIDTPLTIKQGGHSDQLSKAPGLDKYRIQSLAKLLESDLLSPDQIAAAVKVLKKKTAIYANGCLQRDRKMEALYYTRLAERFGSLA